MALISDVVAGGVIEPSWGNAIRSATVQVTTSGARPSPATEGMLIYETDTDLMLVYSGAAWVQVANSATTNVFGTWTNFTATAVQLTTPTQTLTYARFARIGKLVMGNVYISFSAGTTGTSGNALTVTTSGLPAPVRQLNVGSFAYNENGVGFYTGVLQLTTTPTFIFYQGTAGAYTSQLGVTPTVTVGGHASDHLEFNFTYEAAT
jgi:hypothetical protein